MQERHTYDARGQCGHACGSPSKPRRVRSTITDDADVHTCMHAFIYACISCDDVYVVHFSSGARAYGRIPLPIRLASAHTGRRRRRRKWHALRYVVLIVGGVPSVCVCVCVYLILSALPRCCSGWSLWSAVSRPHKRPINPIRRMCPLYVLLHVMQCCVFVCRYAERIVYAGFGYNSTCVLHVIIAFTPFGVRHTLRT